MYILATGTSDIAVKCFQILKHTFNATNTAAPSRRQCNAVSDVKCVSAYVYSA